MSLPSSCRWSSSSHREQHLPTAYTRRQGKEAVAVAGLLLGRVARFACAGVAVRGKCLRVQDARFGEIKMPQTITSMVKQPDGDSGRIERIRGGVKRTSRAGLALLSLQPKQARSEEKPRPDEPGCVSQAPHRAPDRQSIAAALGCVADGDGMIACAVGAKLSPKIWSSARGHEGADELLYTVHACCTGHETSFP